MIFIARMLTVIQHFYIDDGYLCFSFQKVVVSKFGMKEYLGCEEASSLLKLKLNMVDLRANYKGKYTDSLCRRCGSHEEYIEHLWDSPNFYQRPKTEKTCLDTNNSEVLKSINKTLQRFLTNNWQNVSTSL